MIAAGRMPICIALALVTVACGGEREQQACRMETEAVLASIADAPNTLTMSRSVFGDLVVAWSSGCKTSFVKMDENGTKLGEVRVLERYSAAPHKYDAVEDGGIKTFWPAMEGTSFRAEHLDSCGLKAGGVAVGILERPSGGRVGGAHVAVIHGDDEQVGIVRVGAAGVFASSISLVARGKSLVAAWHEGDPESSRIRLASVDPETLLVTGVKSMPVTGTGAGPSLAANEGKVLISWIEIVRRKKESVARIRTAILGDGLEIDNLNTVAECRFLDCAPSLAVVGERFGIAYRDDADDDGKPEFYFMMIDSDGKPAGSPARISRADGFQGPLITYGDPLVFSAAIRSYQHNFLVGLNRFDRKGVKKGGEFQIYADKSDFIRVAIDAQGDRVLLVYGEDRQGSGRILFGRVNCTER